MTPRQSVQKECRERGRSLVVTGCVDLLAGKEVDPTLIYALGGPPARWAVVGGEGGPDYWLRVWASRGLLWAWDDSAAPALEKALSDPAWRVREMAAKVAGHHQLGDLLGALERLGDDPNHRVRAAAERAVARIITASA
jgi:HEAT repeat protein